MRQSRHPASGQFLSKSAIVKHPSAPIKVKVPGTSGALQPGPKKAPKTGEPIYSSQQQ